MSRRVFVVRVSKSILEMSIFSSSIFESFTIIDSAIRCCFRDENFGVDFNCDFEFCFDEVDEISIANCWDLVFDKIYLRITIFRDVCVISNNFKFKISRNWSISFRFANWVASDIEISSLSVDEKLLLSLKLSRERLLLNHATLNDRLICFFKLISR